MSQIKCASNRKRD